MNDLSTSVNTEWLTMEEAAQALGVTTSAVSHALKKHPDIKTECTKKTGRRLYITKHGLALLAALRNKFQGNQHVKANEHVLKSRDQLQKEFTKQSIAKANVAQELAKENALLRSTIARFEAKIAQLEQNQTKLLSPTEEPLTQSQRNHLNERVRAIAFESGGNFKKWWRLVHDSVGRRSIETYSMEDYWAAIKYIKKLYRQYGLSW